MKKAPRAKTTSVLEIPMRLMKNILGNKFTLLFLFPLVLLLALGTTIFFGVLDPAIIEGGDHHLLASYAYDNWAAVMLSIGLFSFFIVGFIVPTRKREWRTAGLYEAFLIALFTEMYGFPLTLYILSSAFDWRLSFGHIQGHLSAVFLAKTGIMTIEGAWILIMLISSLLILYSLFLLAMGWIKIHASNGTLVTDGIYKYVRHPQYLGLFILVAALLIQWPTILSVIMAPILVAAYYKLAKKEEKEALAAFGEAYERYKQNTPMFFPGIFNMRYRQDIQGR
jgi:protein-S-isoprenylcysteine O-methyltransferase Ste14